MVDTRVAGVSHTDFVRSLRVGTLAFCLILPFDFVPILTPFQPPRQVTAPSTQGPVSQKRPPRGGAWRAQRPVRPGLPVA